MIFVFSSAVTAHVSIPLNKNSLPQYLNGFNGLVSIVDTEKLRLPEKWDLADDVPDASVLTDIGIVGAIEKARVDNRTISNRLEMNQEMSNQSGKGNVVLGSIEMLVETSKISKDEYTSKSSTIIAIADSKGVGLSNIEGHKEFIEAVNDASYEYQYLQKEYDEDKSKEDQQTLNNNAQLGAKEQLASEIVRDISILHQVQLGVSKLPKTHSQHIANTVNAETKQMSKFNASDKEHAANNIYKIVSSAEWGEQLDAKNQEQAHSISIRYTAKTIDEFLDGSNSGISSINHGAKEALDNIRAHGIDETAIFATFKQDHAQGLEALKEQSEKLTIASGFAADNKELLNEAKRFGYNADYLETVRSLFGMDEQEAKRACLEIRDSHFSEHLDNRIEKTLQSFEIEKSSAKTSKEVMSIIAKEQDYLSEMHDNIKSPEYHRKEIYQATLAAKMNIEKNTIAALDNALEANQKQGIKSDKELMNILNTANGNIPKVTEELKEIAEFEQKTHLRRHGIELKCLEKLHYSVDKDKLVSEVKSMNSEEKAEHINNILAKETKKYVEPLLAPHAEEKAKAKCLTEMMSALEKEHKTYCHLFKEHEMAIYALDKSNGNMKLSVAISGANDINNFGGMKDVQQVIDHSIDHNIRTEDKIFNDLKNKEVNIKLFSKELESKCVHHHIDQVNRHIEDLNNNTDVFIGNHRFNDKSMYLNHLKQNYNHDYMPTDLIDKHLQHIHDHHLEESRQAEKEHQHENQKQLHLNKTIGGPSL